MKRILLSLFLSVIIVSAFSQNGPAIRILNNTGYTVEYIYVSQTASDNWYEDILGDKVLPDGESVTVNLPYPLDVTNRYDIRIVDEDEDNYTKWDVLVNADSRIEFTLSDIDEDSSTDDSEDTDALPKVSIGNNTGYAIYYAYISTTASGSWGDDLLGDDIIEDGEDVSVRLPYELNVVNRYDIKLVDEDYDSYTKWNVLITPDSWIEFTLADLVLASTSDDLTTEGLPQVKIINNTGFTIYNVYMSETGSDDWEEDVLDYEILDDGESVTIELPYPLDDVNRYDIKLVDEDDDSYIKWDVLIRSGSKIEFTLEDLDFF